MSRSKQVLRVQMVDEGKTGLAWIDLDRCQSQLSSADRQKTLVTMLVTKYNISMHVIAKRTLREFWEKHPDAEQPLKAWHNIAQSATWHTPADIKAQFRSASLVAHNRVVFNIAGNKYRLVVVVRYRIQRVFVRFIGTHQEYDQTDVSEV